MILILSCMATYEVSVYVTWDLYNHCDSEYGDGYRAQSRAKTYLEGAFSYSSDSINVQTPTERINTPTEKVLDSFDAQPPCTNISEGTYNNLGQWWEDRFSYCDDISPSYDVDLLLTSYDSEGGICINDQYACAEGGQHVADLPSSHYLYGCTRPYNSMQTALHEVAHGLLNHSNEHEMGYTYDHSGTKAKTPMATTGQDNVCSNYVDQDDGCWEMRYSDCCESYMQHT